MIVCPAENRHAETPWGNQRLVVMMRSDSDLSRKTCPVDDVSRQWRLQAIVDSGENPIEPRSIQAVLRPEYGISRMWYVQKKRKINETMLAHKKANTTQDKWSKPYMQALIGRTYGNEATELTRATINLEILEVLEVCRKIRPLCAPLDLCNLPS